MPRMLRNCVLWIFLACMTGCADQMLLYPSTQPASPGGAQRREISVQGKIVEVFVARSSGAAKESPQAYALEFTGNATRAEYVVNYIAHRWGDRPVEVWVMNYPGFGASTGPANLHDIPSAALATYDALANEAHGRPIFVCGSSLGTCAALFVASQRPVAGMILQNPPPLQTAIMQRYGFWTAPFVVQIPAELNSLDTAPKVKAPAIFVLAGKDQTVPPRFAQMVVDAYAGEKHLVRMPEAGHNSPIAGEALAQFQRELDWLWSVIAKQE